MKDICFICLSDCDTYIKLDVCSCKMILHEKCFKMYTSCIGYTNCIICHKMIYNSNIININNINNINNTYLYSLFFFLQNLYFYFDDKFMSNSYIIVRLVIVVLYHCVLMTVLSLVSIFPYIIVYNINKIYSMISKPYKVYNL
jgi:hypothetical protein